MADYLLIGTTTADITPNGRALGGTVSYAAPVLAAFGHTVKIVTSGNPDDPLIQQLQTFAECCVIPSQHTPTFENRYDNTAHRTQYIRHTAETITAKHIPEAWQHIEHVHTAPLADDVDVSIAKLFADSTVLLTPQGLLRQWDKTGLVTPKRWTDRNFLDEVDILISSTEDFRGIVELKKYYAQIVPHVIYTDGEQGGLYVGAHTNGTRYNAYSTQEVDPTGAGDVFAAGVFGSLPFVNNDMHRAIQVGARLAAYNVSVQGVAQFTTEFIEDILEQVNK